MKLFKSILLGFLLLTFGVANAQCLEVTSIFVNACVVGTGTSNCTQEGPNEMFTFTTGPTVLNTSDILVNWPSNTFQGWCQSTATALRTDSLNNTITSSCGLLLEPVGGLIPPNSNVIVLTSENFCANANSFDGLADTMYIVYQCAGNTAGHFANNPPAPRTLIVIVSGPCIQTETATYDSAIPNTDGATAIFDAAGNVSYAILGCNAPVISLSAAWTFTNEICNDFGVVDLNTLLTGNATPGGTWSGPRVSGSNYNSSGYTGLDSISYAVTGTGNCTETIDSTIIFNVVTPQTGIVNVQSCDSAFINGIWYSSSTTFSDTIFGFGFECDSFLNYNITIDNAITDSVFLSSCDSVVFDGTTYTSNVILRDTIFGGVGGPIVIDTILQTSFEDVEGWVDHNSGNWTQIDAYGTWNAVDMYANQFNPNNGIRNVGMNDVGDYLELPPVSNPQTLYYFDRLSSAATSTNELTVEYFDGMLWQAISSDICTHLVYELVTVDLSSISGLTNVAIRIIRTLDNRSAYIDDIVVIGSTSSTGSSCDSIFVTNIEILDPIVTNDPLNPIIICNSNDSAQLADGSFVSAAGSYPILYPNGSASGCDSTFVTVIQTQNCNFTCSFDTLLFDSYEYVGNVPGVVPNSIFQPQTTEATGIFAGRARSGNRFFYMNFQNGFTGTVYTRTIDVCANADFRYSFWIRQYDNSVGSNFNINIYDGMGTSGTLISTQNIINSGTIYNQINSPTLFATSGQITFELVTVTPGTGGNDLCFDDLLIEICALDTFALASQSYCSNNPPVNLYTEAAPPTGTSGTWSGPSVLANGHLGTFDPATSTYGTYYYAVPGPSNCADTTVSINISNLSEQIGTANVTACDSTQFNGTWYFASTTVNDTILGGASNTCDSLVQTTITINNSSITSNPGNPFTICESNDSVQLPGGTFASNAGNYSFTFPGGASNGCDSTIITEVLTQICNCDFDLGPDTAFCQGESIILDAGAGFDTYTWQNNSTNQTFTANATGTYYVTTTFIDSSNNLVANGDFEQGNTGFTSDYGPGTGGNFGLLTNPGTYAINTSPSNVHNNFFSCSDQTSGTGNMMIVNGSNIVNTNVWCQTITVNPNTNYVFSAWATSLENTNFANVSTLHFLVDGIQIGPNFSPSFTACDWQQFSTNWLSGSSSSIQICIESDVISGNNDYALDDIFFTPFCNSTDSIDITVNPIPSPGLGPNLEICQGASTLIDATSSGANYLWQDGTTTSSTFTAQNAGLYWVDVTINNCTGRDSINLSVNPVFNQTATASICDGDSAFLANAWQASAGVYTDNFNTVNGCDSAVVTTLNVVITQTQNEVIEVCENELPLDVFGTPTSAPGNYADTIISALGCDSIISNIELIVNPLPTVSLGIDTTINAGSEVVLTVENANATDTYSWTNSLGEVFAGESITTSPTETATYILATINQFNCSSIDSLLVIVNPLEQVLIQLPTAFSPNGDGTNDVFRIANFEDFESYTLRVYNRWGELLFDNQGYNVSWNGSFQGIKQNIGVYAFYIEALPLSGAATMRISGNITLIR
jgi:gliding motility-associated-like protein